MKADAGMLMLSTPTAVAHDARTNNQDSALPFARLLVSYGAGCHFARVGHVFDCAQLEHGDVLRARRFPDSDAGAHDTTRMIYFSHDLQCKCIFLSVVTASMWPPYGHYMATSIAQRHPGLTCQAGNSEINCSQPFRSA